MKTQINMRAKTALIAFLALSSLALTTTPALAEGGGGIGNGGGAWVCREANGDIRWSKLVDLFEAENEFGLTLTKYSGTVQEIVEQMELRILNVNRDLYEALVPHFDKVAYLEEHPPQTTYTRDMLNIIGDSKDRLLPDPARCAGGTLKYEQVVNYKNDGLILVQSKIFNTLSNSAKASLVLHEAIYAYRRKVSGDENSVNSRRIVGLVSSTLSTDELKKELENLDESEIGAVGIKFIPIRPDSFMMGSPVNEAGRTGDEQQHLVQITRGFEIQNTEVTQAQWVEVMGSNPSNFQKYENCPETYKVVKTVAMCPNHPVEQVSWNDVQIFLSKLNARHPGTGGYFYRLPTEAEWEYAARAGNQTAYSFGNNPNELIQCGYFSSNSENQTHNTGELKPNGLGLYDIHGNVWEWVSDWRGYYNMQLTIDPFGPSDGKYRVIRGGSWDLDATLARSASRNIGRPNSRYDHVGFRLVRTR